MTLAIPRRGLGRFVEGTLGEHERKAIVAHIADCDECRIVVVDAAEFVEPAIVHSERRWWMSAAALPYLSPLAQRSTTTKFVIRWQRPRNLCTTADSAD